MTGGGPRRLTPLLPALLAPLTARHLYSMAPGWHALFAEPERPPARPAPWLNPVIQAAQPERQIRPWR